MRVLITNNTLAARAGSELYVRDVALSLLQRGHTPIAYSPALGEVAGELTAATVPVIDDLNRLANPPDIIHGQHHLETMIALLHFPEVPSVFFCHGWMPWEEAAPVFPRILRYVAVDHTCRDRLLIEQSIREERVRTILNFVDLARFKRRPPLPDRPRRALVFSNSASDQTHLPVVQQACELAGITVDAAGIGVGNVLKKPETVLARYDLVFAKARSALEALAVGNAVVVCDSIGTGPMVTTRNVHELRPLNFGIRALQKKLTAEALLEQIEQYDSADAAQVSSMIRASSGREEAVSQILSVYEEVLAEFSKSRIDVRAEHKATSEYLRGLSPLLKERAAQRWHRSYDGREPRDENLRLNGTSQLKPILDELNRQQEQLARQGELLIKYLEQDSRAAEHRIGAAHDEIADSLRRELQERQDELERIRSSVGWRLLRKYGPIKYRVVLPAATTLKKLWPRRKTRDE